MKFRAELETAGKTATGFEVPAQIVERLGAGGHPKVVVTVNGFAFRTSIAKMGGRFLVGVSADRRTQAGIEAGQVFDAIIAWGDEEAVRRRVKEHRAAGADHVCVQVLTADQREFPREQWRRLAAALL